MPFRAWAHSLTIGYSRETTAEQRWNRADKGWGDSLKNQRVPIHRAVKSAHVDTDLLSFPVPGVQPYWLPVSDWVQ